MNEYTLKDLIKINNGKDYRHLSEGAIPVYGSGGVMCYVDKFLHDGECILLPRKGTLDNIMYVTGKFWTVDTMYWATVNEELVDSRYLYLYLTQLDLSNLDTGSTLPSMTYDTYNMVPIKLPNLSVQRDVADRIFAIRDKISLNNSICANLEAIAKQLYDYWFTQFDFPDENGKPYKSSGGKMVWNEKLKREIPEGWEVNSLSNYCTFENGDRGNNYPSGDDFIQDGIPFVAGGALKADEIDYNEIRYISEDKYNSLRAGKANRGDILMTLRGSLAKCVYSPFPKMAIASALVIVRPDNGVSREYLHRVLISEYYVQLLKNYDNGSVQANLSVDTVKSFPMMYPQKEVMDAFTHSICLIEEKEAMLRNENQQLASLRDFLLPMLMNGQVKIGKNNT